MRSLTEVRQAIQPRAAKLMSAEVCRDLGGLSRRQRILGTDKTTFKDNAVLVEAVHSAQLTRGHDRWQRYRTRRGRPGLHAGRIHVVQLGGGLLLDIRGRSRRSYIVPARTPRQLR
jgi:hypothetical protein